jgi:hypothetical protein
MARTNGHVNRAGAHAGTSGGRVNLANEELQRLLAENEALRDQVRALERERDGAMRGIEVLTDGLRRRGCCDHEPSNGSL